MLARMEGKGNLISAGWNVIPPTTEISRRFLKKLKIDLPYDPAI
jgi:hypothetical protein